MSGTIPLSMTQQLDVLGMPLAGGNLYIIQAGTVSTPQIAYQDSALAIPVAGGSRITLDAAGRIPQFFLADGSIKVRLTDVKGVEQYTADGILVIGPSGGGGGGSTLDATTVLATGDIKARYGIGVLAGFVRANARTIGSSTSGATERANADTQALFEYLWNNDVNLTVSSGRGATSIADWLANKTIALPDWRGRNIAGLDDMGNTAAGILPTAYYGTSAIVLGAAGGGASQILSIANLPPYTPAGTITNGVITPTGNTAYQSNTGGVGVASGGGVTVNAAASVVTSATQTASTFAGTAQGGTSTNFSVMNPSRLTTIYLKL